MARLGLQLYTVIGEARWDIFATIRRIAVLGYEGLEFPGGIRDMIGAGELRALLEETNLAMAGIVFSIKELDEELDNVVDYCRRTMCDTIVIPWIDEHLRTAQGYRCIAQKFNQWGSGTVHAAVSRYLFALALKERFDLWLVRSLTVRTSYTIGNRWKSPETDDKRSTAIDVISCIGTDFSLGEKDCSDRWTLCYKKIDYEMHQKAVRFPASKQVNKFRLNSLIMRS